MLASLKDVIKYSKTHLNSRNISQYMEKNNTYVEQMVATKSFLINQNLKDTDQFILKKDTTNARYVKRDSHWILTSKHI